MTEALQALVLFVFDRLGLHRIEAACLPHNAPAAASAQGQVPRGRLCPPVSRINGSWQDHVLYALCAAICAMVPR
jgi:ribosomal-protein-alanine N-acetyltransferase